MGKEKEERSVAVKKFSPDPIKDNRNACLLDWILLALRNTCTVHFVYLCWLARAINPFNPLPELEPASCIILLPTALTLLSYRIGVDIETPDRPSEILQ